MIDIATVCYRDLEKTQRFIRSIIEKTTEPFNLVIVDNNSEADVLNLLDTLRTSKMPPLLKSLTIIRNEVNLGIGIGMNQAMRECKSDYIIRCDSDIEIVTSGWTELLTETAKKSSMIGAVATKSCGGNLRSRDGIIETNIILSNCMLIPRTAIRKICATVKNRRSEILERLIPFLNQPEKFEGHHRYLEAIKHWLLKPDGCWDAGWPLYGFDDFDYSYTLLWSDLILTKDDRVDVIHHDSSLRPDWKETRHKAVSEGARYFRTKWEIIEDHWDDPESPGGKGWKDLYHFLPRIRKYNSGVLESIK